MSSVRGPQRPLLRSRPKLASTFMARCEQLSWRQFGVHRDRHVDEARLIEHAPRRGAVMRGGVAEGHVLAVGEERDRVGERLAYVADIAAKTEQRVQP